MRIKCLAQGNNILLPGFEPSTSVSKTDILTNRLHVVRYKTAIFTYKACYGLVPADILSYFTHISNVYSTRQHKNSCVHYARTKHEQMCVEHMDVNILSSIEIETRNSKDLRLFKVKHKKSLLRPT